MRREVPLAITFISGVALIIALFVPHEPFGTLEQRFNDWYIIVSGFTLILGYDSLLLHHWGKIRRRKEGWVHSVALIAAFFVTLIWGFYAGWRHGSPFAPQSSFLKYYYTYTLVPLQATMFSLLAFFIASAAYRAFRARKLDATLLLVAAGLVMLGRVPRGQDAAFPLAAVVMILLAVFFVLEGRLEVSPLRRGIYYGGALLMLLLIWPVGLYLKANLPQIAGWIMNVPQLAAKRGILIGIALGAIAMSLRIILGIERTYLK